MPKFGLNAKFYTKDNDQEQLIDILSEAAKHVLQNVEGCLQYELHQPIDRDDYILVTEIWESEDDHLNSLKDAHVLNLISKAKRLIAKMEVVRFASLNGQ